MMAKPGDPGKKDAASGYDCCVWSMRNAPMAKAKKREIDGESRVTGPRADEARKRA
jgi:hypothetical protein